MEDESVLKDKKDDSIIEFIEKTDPKIFEQAMEARVNKFPFSYRTYVTHEKLKKLSKNVDRILDDDKVNSNVDKL